MVPIYRVPVPPSRTVVLYWGGFLRGMGGPRVPVTFVRSSSVSWEREDLM